MYCCAKNITYRPAPLQLPHNGRIGAAGKRCGHLPNPEREAGGEAVSASARESLLPYRCPNTAERLCTRPEQSRRWRKRQATGR